MKVVNRNKETSLFGPTTISAKLQVLADSIVSAVTGQGTYTDPDGNTSTSSIGTLVQQTAGNVLVAATQAAQTATAAGQTIIQSFINVAPNGVKISAEKVDIEGAAIFSSGGRLSQASLDAAYDASGAAADVNDALEEYMTATDATIEDLQQQVDGQIESWFETSDPATTAYNATDTPTDAAAASWTTAALKDAHIGDLYYNVTSGHSWRWMKSGTTWQWLAIPDSDAAAALSAANSAAKRVQQVFYRSNSTTAPTLSNSAWITSTSTANGTWTTKRMPYDSAYKYLYTSIQKEKVDGTIEHTTVLLDETVTVIDGGNIITGTVSANQIDAESVKTNIVQTTELSASNITSGTLNAARIAAGSLPVEKLSNLEIGGRNLLRRTGAFVADNWVMARSSIISPGLLQLTPTTSTAASKYKVDYLDFAEYGSGTYTFSFDAREVPDASSTYSSSPNITAYIGFSTAARATSGTFNSSYDRYKGLGITGVTQEWKRFSYTLTAPDGMTTGKTSALVAGSQLTVQVYREASLLPVQVRNVKLEKGTIPSEWSPAPEDAENNIATVVNSLHVSDERVNTLSETLSALGNSFNALNQYVLTDNNGVTITASGSPVVARMTNAGLRFLQSSLYDNQGDSAPSIAEMVVVDGEGVLKVNVAIVLSELRFGNWMWYERPNGNMSLKYTG